MHIRQILLNLCLVVAGGFVSFVDIQPAFATETLPIMTVTFPLITAITTDKQSSLPGSL